MTLFSSAASAGLDTDAVHAGERAAAPLEARAAERLNGAAPSAAADRAALALVIWFAARAEGEPLQAGSSDLDWQGGQSAESEPSDLRLELGRLDANRSTQAHELSREHTR